MNELSLFTGAGGGLLGTHLLGWTPIGYVEYDDYCQRIIRARIDDGILPNAPIFGDIRTFIDSGSAEFYRGVTDVVTGGFPCQAHSSAPRGHRTARDWWPEMRTVVEIVNPPYVWAENVSRAAIDTAARDLRKLGYRTKSRCLSAADLGADHIRKRHWLLAYADSYSKLLGTINAKMGIVPEFCTSVWRTYPHESGVADGMAHRVDRLKAVGNGQVPTVVRAAWEVLTEGVVAPIT